VVGCCWGWSNQNSGQPKLNRDSELENATTTIYAQLRTRLDVLSPLAVRAKEVYLRGCGGGGGGCGLRCLKVSKCSFLRARRMLKPMRPPSCYAQRGAEISTEGVCCDWDGGKGQGMDILTCCVVGCCQEQAAKLTSGIIYTPTTARGGARARSRNDDIWQAKTLQAR
jgi:hypothetical protein